VESDGHRDEEYQQGKPKYNILTSSFGLANEVVGCGSGNSDTVGYGCPLKELDSESVYFIQFKKWNKYHCV